MFCFASRRGFLGVDTARAGGGEADGIAVGRRDFPAVFVAGLFDEGAVEDVHGRALCFTRLGMSLSWRIPIQLRTSIANLGLYFPQ